jgi:hypothetical protein
LSIRAPRSGATLAFHLKEGAWMSPMFDEDPGERGDGAYGAAPLVWTVMGAIVVFLYLIALILLRPAP